MPVDRRLRAKIVLAFVMACFAAPVGIADVQAANPLTLNVQVGYRGTVKLGQWMPVTVDATNAGPDLDGILEVQGTSTQGGPSGQAVYEMPISLASGATKRFRTFVMIDQPGMTVTVRIVRNGRVLISSDTFTANGATGLIGVLSDQPTALDSFAAVHPAGITAAVAHLTPDELSDQAMFLRGFDLLVFDDFATDTLTAAKRAAITDYVENGGALLIGTGASWHKTLAGLPSGILPMNVTGSTMLVTSQALGGLPAIEAATGTLTSGHAWLSEGDRPLLVERAVGRGTVTIATFDWNTEPIASWSGTSALMRQVLVRAAYVNGPSQNFQTNPKMAFIFAQRGGQLSGVLRNLPSLVLPSMWLTGGLVLLYVLLVGPVNYIVLRALKRRALAWITVPLIAIVAAGGAYGAGVLTKGRAVQTNQVSIIHVQPGWDHAYAETFTGVLTPTRGDYQARIGGNGHLISPIYAYGDGYGGPSQGIIRVNLDSGVVDMPGMIAFTLRGFSTESLTAAPHLTASLKLINGQLTGTVENQSSTNFTDAVLIAGDGYQKLPALKAGSSTTVTVTPKATNTFGGPPAFTSIYPNYSYGQNGPQPSQPTDAQREGDTKTQILSMLGIVNYFGGASPTVPLLVAWTKEPVDTVTVNGSQPRSYAVTAVAVQLSVDQIGAGPLPAGIVTGRMVDVVDAPQQGQAGGVVIGPPGAGMPNGTATYEFRPSLAAGARLTNALLSSSTPMMGKFGPPGSGQATPTAQVWDWSHSRWVDFNYRDNVDNAIPDVAVNQSTGEVRLKLTVQNGGFMYSGPSLTGTVQ